MRGTCAAGFHQEHESILDWAKPNPKNAFYATTSAGGTPHFVGVMLARDSGVALSPVHYKGGAPALQDLIGGQIPVSVNPIGEVLPYLKSGRLRVLATTGETRSKFLPDVPDAGRNRIPQIVAAPWLALLRAGEDAGRRGRPPGGRDRRGREGAGDDRQSFEKFGYDVVTSAPAAHRRDAQGRPRALAADRQGVRLHRRGLECKERSRSRSTSPSRTR